MQDIQQGDRVERYPAAALADHHEQIRADVEEVCARYPDRYWRDLDFSRSYPEAFFNDLVATGWLGALIPAEYGGKGLGITEACVLLETIGRCGGAATTVHAQVYTAGTLVRHASEEMKQRFLPGIANGSTRLLTMALTEHEAGLNTAAIQTTAVKDGAEYRLSGSKNWVSRLQHTDLVLVFARTTPLAEAAKKTEGISAFLLEVPADGMHVEPIRAMMNLETNRVRFDAVRVPEANLVGREGAAFRYILSGVNGDRICAASAAIGDARWLLDKAISFASQREVFGRPIGSNQGIQFPLAHAYASVEAAASLRDRAAAAYDRDDPAGGTLANMAKLTASEAVAEAAEATMSTYGGYAFDADHDVERKYRETRLYQNAPGSNHLILANLAQHTLGLPRSF